MKWQYRCKSSWLKARQECLTASDVKDLLPFTATGRKRAVTDNMRLKVLARKEKTILKDDCVSKGAAARGHVLEPFAINAYNAAAQVELYNWDNVVITRPAHETGNLAFSPDALNFRQPLRTPPMIGLTNITEIGEVKSYSEETHLVKGFADKLDLEERWQVATAMAVCPTIDKAHLILFNPSMKDYEIFAFTYTPSELADEIQAILDVEEDWMKWLYQVKGQQTASSTVFPGQNKFHELAIAESIVEQEACSPDEMKTVFL